MKMESKFWVIKINIFFLLLLSILINGQGKDLSINDVNLILEKKEFFINLKKSKENSYYKVYSDNNIITEIEIPKEKINQLEINKSIITTGKIKFYSIDKNTRIELQINQSLSLSRVKKNCVQFQFHIPDEKIVNDKKVLYFNNKQPVEADIIWFNKVPKDMEKHTYIHILSQPEIIFNININYYNMPINELINLLIEKYGVK